MLQFPDNMVKVIVYNNMMTESCVFHWDCWKVTLLIINWKGGGGRSNIFTWNKRIKWRDKKISFSKKRSVILKCSDVLIRWHELSQVCFVNNLSTFNLGYVFRKKREEQSNPAEQGPCTYPNSLSFALQTDKWFSGIVL